MAPKLNLTALFRSVHIIQTTNPIISKTFYSTMASLPSTIRAVHQPDPNSSTLKLVEAPIPTIAKPDDVLVKVAATAPCLGELWWARDFSQMFTEPREPVPGQDMAGTVVQSPEGSKFKPGDEVFCRIEAMRAGGAREYTLAKEVELALKPKSLSWTDAAATPLSALTAWQNVFTQNILESSAVFGDQEARKRNSTKRILITAGGGSVGGWAVQFAAAAGAGAVVTTCQGSKADAVRALGATEIIDYTKQSIEDWVAQDRANREVDGIADCIGGPAMGQLWSVVKEGGTFTSISRPPDSVKPADSTKTLAKSEFFVVQSLGSELSQIAKLIDSGSFRPLVDSVMEFEQFQEAFDKVESRKTNGKVILKVTI
ncbi:hypothetical protein jhhlp_001730 [Lomentospora prolificans]|uniref:Enoyl reductase (ER) domain-containing protein n=1 Tax=Lomentospora prolificans TaxID=41688 RepID=A0A2N3NHC5_9PEZI|nr:hypothetical protein jhhlp_001730 [Lomentospora prolificans]